MTKKSPKKTIIQPKATIREVALAAGFSITTASHVLNNRRDLPESTRQAIFQAVKKVGYRPNPSARSLRTGVTKIIGLTLRPTNAVHGSLSGTEYHLRLAGAVATAALDRGLGLLQLPGKMLLEGGLPTDGYIIVAPFGGDTVLNDALQRGIPVVTADPDPDRKDFKWWAGRDESIGVRLLLNHLTEKGSERIALITGQDDNSWTRGSREAYETWCTETGMKPSVTALPESAGLQGGIDIGTKLLTKKRRPDAIISASSLFAAGIATAAQTLGMVIPRDVRVAAMSDSEITRSFDPPITALDLQPEAIGRACVDLLYSSIAGERGEPFVTSSILRRRGSTA